MVQPNTRELSATPPDASSRNAVVDAREFALIQSREKKERLKRLAFEIAVLGTILVLIYLAQYINYLVFHVMAELFSITILGAIFIICWNTRHLSKNTFFLVIGVSAFFISIIDILHTLAYKGMNLFLGYLPETNLPTQLWIYGRYFQSATILLALLLINKQIRSRYLIASFLLVNTLFLFMIFTQTFPAAHDGSALTPFKISSEYIIIAVLGLSIYLLIRHRAEFSPDTFKLIALFLASLMISEMCFTFYVGVYDLSNLIGHIFRILASAFFYKAIIQINLKKPLVSLFKKLTDDEIALKKKAEDLETSNKQLQQEIAKRVQAETVLHEFISAMSHELRTPVTVLSHAIHNLITFNEKLGADQKAELLSSISRNIALMSELMEDLLTLSRVDEGRLALEWSTVDLNVLITEVVSLFDAVIKDKEIALTVTGDKDVHVQADRKLVGRVVRIFTDNAVKYSPDGSKVEIRVIDNYKGEYNSRNVDGVLIQFIDNGIGIEKDLLPKIFQRFVRSERVKEMPGTGLGLPIAKEIVEKHGGQITVSSVVDKGTTFSVFLPENNK